MTRHVTRTREECQYLAKKLEEFGNVEFLAPSGWSRGGERHAASLHPFRFVSLSLSRPSFFYNHLVIILDTPDARTRILDRARTIIPFFISLEKSGRKFYEIVAIKNFLTLSKDDTFQFLSNFSQSSPNSFPRHSERKGISPFERYRYNATYLRSPRNGERGEQR